MSDLVGVLVLVGISAILGAMVLMSYYKNKRREAQYPRTWIHKGTPPPDIDLALMIIRELSPYKLERFGGYIEWIQGPFDCSTVRAAGCLDTDGEPYIRLMYFPEPEKTALAHEIGHWIFYGAGRGYMEGTPEFVAWVNTVNLAIHTERIRRAQRT